MASFLFYQSNNLASIEGKPTRIIRENLSIIQLIPECRQGEASRDCIYNIIILTAKWFNLSMVCQKAHNFIKDLWLLFIYAPLPLREMVNIITICAGIFIALPIGAAMFGWWPVSLCVIFFIVSSSNQVLTFNTIYWAPTRQRRKLNKSYSWTFQERKCLEYCVYWNTGTIASGKTVFRYFYPNICGHVPQLTYRSVKGSVLFHNRFKQKQYPG